MTDYNLLNAQLNSLVEDIPYNIANLSNASALLFHSLEDINWAGFYLMQDNFLILGPFQGNTACIKIPIGRGVCGTAIEKKQTLCVNNVHEFPGHIACDCASNSEIVIPIFLDGQIFGVLDIDSPSYSRFTKEDQAGLEEFVSILQNALVK